MTNGLPSRYPTASRGMTTALSARSISTSTDADRSGISTASVPSTAQAAANVRTFGAMSLVTPIGHTVTDFWSNLLTGQCGVDKITLFDATPFDTQIAAEVRDFNPAPAFPSPKEVRRTDRYSQFGVHAAWQALKDSGLDVTKQNPDNIGVFMGSGIGGLSTTTEQHKILLERGPGRLSPFMIPMLISNMASGLVSMYFGLRGPNFATCSACATSMHVR